eukprot:TRINITY_DN108230_c0_g1_i1.p1 TRINITY_DN108230_c0_g1~~TRINITY_DN108230_c0_g1_i1.p1  ORF type:complete len:177 (+),score=25.22 TRINITY_DN108230_c0_g1_i1:40-531(+)
MWFTMVTVSTVGYGDTVPQSTEGNLVVSVLIIVAALYMAIPIGIVGKTFGSVWDDRERLLLIHRLRVRFTSAGYKPADIPTMFCLFDVDGDGELSESEFIDMLKQMDIDMGSSSCPEFFRMFSLDAKGFIDDEVFMKTLYPEYHSRMYHNESSGDNLDDATSA